MFLSWKIFCFQLYLMNSYYAEWNMMKIKMHKICKFHIKHYDICCLIFLDQYSLLYILQTVNGLIFMEYQFNGGTHKTIHVFVNHGCPRRQRSQNLQVLHYDPTRPQGHAISVRSEQPLDELTVLDHPNFNYYTFYVSSTELRTN